MSEGTLIAARVRTLDEGLETVRRVLAAIEDSRQPAVVQIPVTDVDALALQLRNLRDLGNDVRQAGSLAADGRKNEAEDAATAAAESLEKVSRAVLRSLEALKERPGGSTTRPMIALEDLETGINTGQLLTKAQDAIDTLGGVMQGARRAQNLREDAQEAEAHAAFRRAWRALGRATEASNVVFREYVDLLGGLALRERGFDRGLCRIADQFVRDLENPRDWPWTTWTVPAQREALEVTMARIIRLGFPQWSIWAVPLAAHEFGHQVLATQRFADLVAGADSRRLILLADIFAATVAGPAYAAALFTLRLDPPIATSGAGKRAAELNLGRAYATLTAIKKNDQSAAGLNETEDLRRRLQASWEGSFSWVQPVPAIADNEAGEIDSLVDQMRRKIGTDFHFPIGQWAEINGWAKALNERRSEQIRPKPLADDVRFVLNALWLARLADDAIEPTELATAGTRLAERIGFTDGGDSAPDDQATPDKHSGSTGGESGQFDKVGTGGRTP